HSFQTQGHNPRIDDAECKTAPLFGFHQSFVILVILLIYHQPFLIVDAEYGGADFTLGLLTGAVFAYTKRSIVCIVFTIATRAAQ
ncbi:TPA: hypothetical protein MDU74_003261, partial [Citrobacter freundii]|nr:hypothetical protein [Citrobacter freundii]